MAVTVQCDGVCSKNQPWPLADEILGKDCATGEDGSAGDLAPCCRRRENRQGNDHDRDETACFPLHGRPPLQTGFSTRIYAVPTLRLCPGLNMQTMPWTSWREHVPSPLQPQVLDS